MFIMVMNNGTKEPSIIRASSIIRAEPWGNGVLLQVEGFGEIRTCTYDIEGLAAEIGIDDGILEGFREDAEAAA